MKRGLGQKRRFGRQGRSAPHKQRERSAKPAATPATRRPDSVKAGDFFEVEVLDGLAPVCRDELSELIGKGGRIFEPKNPSAIAFQYGGDRRELLKLRTAVAVFELLYFKVPHPLSVVQGENLSRLLSAISAICAARAFRSFRVNAAGSHSPAFQKIKKAIATQSGLVLDEAEGEMSIRFRRSQIKPFGWDVLIRLTPRPLSARSWRVENMPGALNATIAAAMIRLMDPKPEDRFLNVMCGSGTLLAERSSICRSQALIGVDNSQAALAKARRNLAGLKELTLLEEDAGKLSLQDESANAICADLPWGRLIGDKHELEQCYSESLREMTRVCSAGGKLAIITQENLIFEKVLHRHQKDWRILCALRVKQSDYKPKLYLLQKSRKGSANK